MCACIHFLGRLFRGLNIFMMNALLWCWAVLVLHSRPWHFPLHFLTHTLPHLAIAYGVLYACATELLLDWRKRNV